MSRKKTKYQKKAFESTGVSSDTSANIYMSMLLSPAWMDLSAQQQRLYLYCKAQLYAEKVHPIAEDETSFTMNKTKWSDLYHLYNRDNHKGFIRDMNALINHGFVRCLESGKHNRIKNIYQLSSKWQQWGTPEFEIHPDEMTIAAINQAKKERKRTPTAKGG